MAEPMLVGVFELLWTEAGDERREGVSFDVRQGNRQRDVGHQSVLIQPIARLSFSSPPARRFALRARGEWPRLRSLYWQAKG
jgi:hypothetical protein